MKAILSLMIRGENKYNGVCHFLDLLQCDTASFSNYRVIRLDFIIDSTSILAKQVANNHWEIPLPRSIPNVKSGLYLDAYIQSFMINFSDTLKDVNDVIIHLHTLNLINLALELKKTLKKRRNFIVVHLHCIPWRDLLNYDEDLYYKLYQELVIERIAFNNVKGILREECEPKVYYDADRIICTCGDGVNYIRAIDEHLLSKVRLIPNGIVDAFYKVTEKANITKKLLFVGGLTRSKGFEQLCNAVKTMQQPSKYEIHLAGFGTLRSLNLFLNKYSDINIIYHGILTTEQLSELYLSCDCGIITSFHEQCSYAAIEMMMYGLPIIAAKSPGLDEMFIDGYNALMVNVQFSERNIHISPEELAYAINKITTDYKLRHLLVKNARKYFLANYQLSKTISNLLETYKQLLQ